MHTTDLDTLTLALADAVRTAEAQPATVPALPNGWLTAARQALAMADRLAIETSALEIIDAHTGYSASWESRPWLADLRMAANEPYARRLAKRVALEDGEDRALQAYIRRTGATHAEARAILSDS